jgi:hypothetical protein
VIPALAEPVVASSSMAACESRPGTSKESFIVLPTVDDPTTTPTESTSHTAITVHGRRAAKRPHRYSNPLIAFSSVRTPGRRSADLLPGSCRDVDAGSAATP